MPSSTELARAIVAALRHHGVREVVLAPGSRSAPLAYAIFEADRSGLVRLHVRVDERTASFLALGLAKASDVPVAVITTSGTAAANLHPAVLEAWHAHLPLIMITADRPRALINTGANQTTHQDQLFAAHVRASAQLADGASDLLSCRYEVSRLLAAARGQRSRLPGPVHLNVALSEPLTPSPWPLPDPGPPGVAGEGEEQSPGVGATADEARSGEFATIHQPRPAEPLLLPAGPATVVIAGDGTAQSGLAALDLARLGGFPLLAEPSSRARVGVEAISLYRLLLSTALAGEIERVVVFGRPTLTRPVIALLSDRRLELIVVSAYADWVDPGRHAHAVVDAVAVDRPGGADWLDRWRAADQRLRGELDQFLDTQADFTGPALACTVWTSLGREDVLIAGSSNPVRDLDLAPITEQPPKTYANRGLSGIDGTVSTAAGIALAGGGPTHALIGDLTLLHDASGLFLGPDEPRPDLRIVVANDSGGSIFATLEQGEPGYESAFERIFATPQDLDVAALAAAAGVTYELAENAVRTAELMVKPPQGIEIVDARIDRRNRRALDLAIKDLARSL
jgi:2-succinyl-5-enolpyruvyl-6-hydroxy-3-cyclohexene-1-carboxylate synthase